MSIFESLENLNVSEECFEDIIDMVEELIDETSDERAKAANAETTRKYDAARNAVERTKTLIKRGKGFYTDDEIKDLKKDLKKQEKDFEEAKRKRIRDNRNQFNRDVRLGNIPESILESLVELIEELLNEDIFQTIKKEYAGPQGARKRVELLKKATANKRNERNEAIKRESKPEDLDNASAKVYLKRERRGKENIYEPPTD